MDTTFRHELVKISDVKPDTEGKHTVSWEARLILNEEDDKPVSCLFFFPKSEVQEKDGSWFTPRWVAEESYNKVFKRMRENTRKSLRTSYPEDREWVSTMDKRWLDAPFPKRKRRIG